MIQFTDSEILSMKRKLGVDNSVIGWLKDSVKNLLEHELRIPKTGIATWSHYFCCPYDSSELVFDIENSKEYKCPVCERVFTGEPFEGGWWHIVNGYNSGGCRHIALLWMLTGETRYLDIARHILLGYAKNYENYEEHGGIPNNGPGRAHAQTLDDSNWIQSLVAGYDIIKSELSEDEIGTIENKLLLPCSEFLMNHRTPQIHNHEVIISAAVASLGIVLGRKDILHFALNEKYGLRYQLENGVLKDYLWFEGTLGYHFYALRSFFEFEKFARNTEYGFFKEAYYREMLKFPLKILLPDGRIPSLNDSLNNKGNLKADYLYELAYNVYGLGEFAYILNQGYANQKRNNLDAFLYGVDHLPETGELKLEDYHNSDGSGLTVIRGKNDKYLLFKHAPFGGEHDHYDRLGFLFHGFGDKIVPDLGTVHYGVPMHYDYYKNTGTHNTVVINEENQSPASTVVLDYRQEDGSTFVDAVTKWDGRAVGLDSHYRVEWDEKSYAGVSMRRMFQWYEEYFIEAFIVDGVDNKTIDWVIHVAGELEVNARMKVFEGKFSEKKPFKHLKDFRYVERPENGVKSTWRMPNCELNLFSFCNTENTMLYSKGPNNPSTKDIAYLINRVKGNSAVFVNLFEACRKGESLVEKVGFKVSENQIEVDIYTRSGERRVVLDI